MQLIKIQNPNQLTDVIHSLATGSFEKKFKGVKTSEVIAAFGLVTQDLSQEQIHLGIAILIDKGFCPDPVLFRQWCLGNREFSFADEVADSYHGKHAALANIIKWRSNPKHPISTAEKQAFDDSYHLWQTLNSTADIARAENAFKDFYDKIVKEAVANRIKSTPYIAPVAISQSTAKQAMNQAELEAGRKMGDEVLANLMKQFALQDPSPKPSSSQDLAQESAA